MVHREEHAGDQQGGRGKKTRQNCKQRNREDDNNRSKSGSFRGPHYSRGKAVNGASELF